MIDSDQKVVAEEAPDAGETVTVLEQSLWQALTRAEGVEDTAQAWTAIMFAMLEDIEHCGVFLSDLPGGRLRSVAGWPRARLAGATLIGAAETAKKEGRGVVRGALADDVEARGQGPVSVAVPLKIGDEVQGAVGFEARNLTREQLQDAMRKLQWGSAWVRDALRAKQGIEKDRKYLLAIDALHVVAAVAEQEGFGNAARAAVTDLASRFKCDRVSIGFRRIWRTKVQSISHSAGFDKKMNLVRMLGAAMDEAIDQRGLVVWPDESITEPMATHRHKKFAETHFVGNLLTCPLYVSGKFVGAITFERPADRPFSQHDAEILEAVATVMAPVIDEVRLNDRWLIVKLAGAVARQFGQLVGPGRLLRKALLICAAALVAFFWFATGTHRVSGDARVEGAIQRVITAPFDGFVAASDVRAGDRVAMGDLLVRLDDRELTLERLRLVSKLQLERIEYEQALADRDRAEVSIVGNQIKQSEAEIALIDQQLARTKLEAPFDGIISAGDLSQSIGAAVARGETLLTVVPQDDFRVVLNVDERRIADVIEGQEASLVVTALPESSFGVRIEQITPVAKYGEGRTTFRVDAELTEPAGPLQPGMEGVAKIYIGEKRLIEIWARPLLDWLRLRAWIWAGWEPGRE